MTLPSKGETVLVNPYSFESRPLIHLNGNGAGTLTIDNENGRHEWTFSNIDEFIEIDSEKMCFYKDNTLKNDTVTGTGFPLLVRGENRFILGGGITDGSVFPRWCSL